MTKQKDQEKTVKSKYNGARISVRKVYLVANAIRGKKLVEAEKMLAQIRKKGARILEKALKSAIANAKNQKFDVDHMTLADVKIGPGPTLKRGRIAARGRYMPILKRTANITIVLEGASENQKAPDKGKKETRKPTDSKHEKLQQKSGKRRITKKVKSKTSVVKKKGGHK